LNARENALTSENPNRNAIWVTVIPGDDGDPDGVSVGVFRGERVFPGVQEMVRGVAESVSVMRIVIANL
tara:strand:- start:129 stop:335 length:207 start_codon:yes stop_codon:yes gene_type:complete